jgi:hypothetical protein
VEKPAELLKIASVGDYLSRKYGIVTFTSDALSAVAAEYPLGQRFAAPVNDIAGAYKYPTGVRFEIEEQDLSSYLRAADLLMLRWNWTLCWPRWN